MNISVLKKIKCVLYNKKIQSNTMEDKDSFYEEKDKSYEDNDKFYEEYLKLAPIDKLREIGKCYGIENVKKYKTKFTQKDTEHDKAHYTREKLIHKIQNTEKDHDGKKCHDHYISSCKQCTDKSIGKNNVVEHYKNPHNNRKGKEKDVFIQAKGDGKYKCQCKSKELDGTIEVYRHMYKNHNLIKIDPFKTEREKKERKPRAEGEKRVRVKKERSNEPRKQKNRDLNDFIVFAKNKFDKKDLNKEQSGIQKVLCYPCYKNKKITEIKYNKDKIFQHIIHKHQDLFAVQCTLCGEKMSNADSKYLEHHICSNKENHRLVLPITTSFAKTLTDANFETNSVFTDAESDPDTDDFFVDI